MSDPVSKVQIMGILNVTPDSFSDGGKYTSVNEVYRQAEEMISAGADILDVGGESSRPFSNPVPVKEELDRVIPPIKAIRKNHSIPISIDTTKAEVAKAALGAGADIINDISALRFDSGMISLALETDVPIIIMHMLGNPKTMQFDPAYDDVVGEISGFLEERLLWAEEQGVSRDRFIVDPGIGFGKTVEHNLSILRHLSEFNKLGCPVLIGHSRKAFIGKILERDVEDRDIATAAVSALCTMNGASIIRVHDVEKTVQAVRMAEAVRDAK